MAHRMWVTAQRFDEPALNAALGAYQGALSAREAELAALEAQLHMLAGLEPLATAVGRLSCYRGIAELTALTLVAEVVDWRRFATARAFMGFTGLTPTEYSSGERTRRGAITKAGPESVRTALVEASWSYRNKPAVGIGLRTRQKGAAPQTIARSWTAQQRLCGRYRRMLATGKSPAITPPERRSTLPR